MDGLVLNLVESSEYVGEAPGLAGFGKSVDTLVQNRQRGVVLIIVLQIIIDGVAVVVADDCNVDFVVGINTVVYQLQWQRTAC